MILVHILLFESSKYEKSFSSDNSRFHPYCHSDCPQHKVKSRSLHQNYSLTSLYTSSPSNPHTSAPQDHHLQAIPPILAVVVACPAHLELHSTKILQLCLQARLYMSAGQWLLRLSWRNAGATIEQEDGKEYKKMKRPQLEVL